MSKITLNDLRSHQIHKTLLTNERAEEIADRSEEDFDSTDERYQLEFYKWLEAPARDWLADVIQPAFTELMMKCEILAREGACCGCCSVAGLAATCVEKDWAGFVYFHEQDLDGLNIQILDEEPVREIYLGFGGNTDGASNGYTDLEVAQLTVATLKEHGVPATWDGTAETRIHVRWELN